MSGTYIFYILSVIVQFSLATNMKSGIKTSQQPTSASNLSTKIKYFK